MKKLLEWDKKNLLKKLLIVATIIVLICFIVIFYNKYLLDNETYKASNAIFTVLKICATTGLLTSLIGLILVSIDYYIYPEKRLQLERLLGLISFICSLIWFIPFSPSEMIQYFKYPYSFYVLMSLITFAFLVGTLITQYLSHRGKEMKIEGLGSICKKIKKVVSNHKKKFIGLLSLVVVVASVLFVLSYVIKIPVDIFNNIEVVFEGVTGDGTVTVNNLNKINNSDKVNTFLKSVNYEISDDEYLENDDEITVTAIVSREKMKDLRIIVDEDQLTKKFTVTGLSTVPKSKEEIPNIEKLDDEVLSKIESLQPYDATVELAKTCYSDKPKGYGTKYGTFVNIYKIVDTDYKDDTPILSEGYEMRGYTNLSLNSEGKLDKKYTQHVPTYMSIPTLEEALSRAQKEGLVCY